MMHAGVKIRNLRTVLMLAVCLLVTGCPADQPAVLQSLVPAEAEAGRWVLLDGAANTRDIGGYRTADGKSVRYGLVYRSSELSGLSAAGCQAFDDLGIRHVIDFRNRLAPSPLFGGDAPCVFASAGMSLLPVLIESADPPENSYAETVVRYADEYRQGFDLVARPDNLPLLYHCAAGKDRAGIMTLLLLTLLGVDRQQAIADYELSALVTDSISTNCALALLDEVDRQGGIEAYLANIGVSADTQAGIKLLLLE